MLIQTKPASSSTRASGKVQVFLGRMREVPGAVAVLEAAVDVPAPAVEAALELAGAALAAAGAQLGAAMQAGVVIGADVVLGDAGDDEAVVADLVDVIVADFGDVFLAAGPLPGAGPQPLELFFLIGRIDVALGVDILAAEIFV